MKLSVLSLPGDGIGPEVLREATRALCELARVFGHRLEIADAAIGAAAIEEVGSPLPGRTLEAALEADAVLLGAVGLPGYDSLPPERRPERGLLDLRKELQVFANIRPSKARRPLLDASPLKNAVAEGTDLVFVRELTSGIYYGTPRGVSGSGDGERAVNTLSYSRGEIDRVARVAFELAGRRRGKVTSVDKSNVLENSQLWRRVVTQVSEDYPDVALEHMLVDNCAMQLILNPRQFDVVLTENMFGDILSDEAAVVAGSIGMLSSASLGAPLSKGGKARKGLYEPVHGSAPDIAGRGVANPLGAILSAAAMLDYTFGLETEAAALAGAVDDVVESGLVTADLRPTGPAASTSEVGQAVCRALEARARQA
jgi:3-isopropylmalate dehydrogenase